MKAIPKEVVKELMSMDLKEGRHKVVIEHGDSDIIIEYYKNITGQYLYANDYIISEPELEFEITEATEIDQEGKIINLKVK